MSLHSGRSKKKDQSIKTIPDLDVCEGYHDEFFINGPEAVKYFRGDFDQQTESRTNSTESALEAMEQVPQASTSRGQDPPRSPTSAEVEIQARQDKEKEKEKDHGNGKGKEMEEKEKMMEKIVLGSESIPTLSGLIMDLLISSKENNSAFHMLSSRIENLEKITSDMKTEYLRVKSDLQYTMEVLEDVGGRMAGMQDDIQLGVKQGIDLLAISERLDSEFSAISKKIDQVVDRSISELAAEQKKRTAAAVFNRMQPTPASSLQTAGSVSTHAAHSVVNVRFLPNETPDERLIKERMKNWTEEDWENEKKWTLVLRVIQGKLFRPKVRASCTYPFLAAFLSRFFKGEMTMEEVYHSTAVLIPTGDYE